MFYNLDFLLHRFFKALYMMLTLTASFKASICTCKTWGWKKSGDGISFLVSIFTWKNMQSFTSWVTVFTVSFNNWFLHCYMYWFILSCHLQKWFSAGADDKPLRMVKTVLHELVKLRGAAIKGHLSMVPIDMKPQPIILAYIDLNLEVEKLVKIFTFCFWSFWFQNFFFHPLI